MNDLMESLLQACDGTPDWYGVSRKHWVMNLDRYKQIRRWATQCRPDPEPDEGKWVPGPDDRLFGYPITVREDAGEPHLVTMEAGGMVSAAPLEDPAYDPVHKPVNGLPPDVVAKWGPRSQVRWFSRFRGQLRGAKEEFWSRFYCTSEAHRGGCCGSCIEDIDMGYRDFDECCCRALWDRA